MLRRCSLLLKLVGPPGTTPFGVGEAGPCVLVPEPAFVHTVKGATLEGVRVFPAFCTPAEEARVSAEAQDFAESKHSLQWGGYRSGGRGALKFSTNFFGKHTHDRTAHISSVDDKKQYIDTVAVQHAPASLKMCVKILESGVVGSTPPNAFRLNEYPFPDSCDLAHRDPEWQGGYFCILSLLSDTVLVFRDTAARAESLVYLPRRSLAHVSGAALQWRHELLPEATVSFPPLNKTVRKDYRCSGVFYSMEIEKVNITDN